MFIFKHRGLESMFVRDLDIYEKEIRKILIYPKPSVLL